MKFTRVIAVSAAAAMLLSGCMGLYQEEDSTAETFTTVEEMETYLNASEDELLSELTEYLAPTHVPEGMTLTNCEVDPERHFVTFYYNLNRYVPTTEEIAEELVKDIDVSVFSFFPTTGMQDTAYDPEKAARTVLKETDGYLFRWNYIPDGPALLEKGLEYYGEPVQIGEQEYYITEVNERMVVKNTPEGQGFDVLFYQIVWTQDDYLFFIKLPKEFAEEYEDILPYTQMTWETID